MKLYLGSGPSPLHPQHRAVMGNPDEWTFVDLYVKEPHIKNWDATKLEEVEDNSVEEIYASHLLEHISHVKTITVLEKWHSKLKDGGKITLNVPDLAWAANQILKWDNDQPLDGYFHDFTGEHGILSIIYGSHSTDGEYHRAGFLKNYLEDLLTFVGFKNVEVKKVFEAHSMGCLIATATK